MPKRNRRNVIEQLGLEEFHGHHGFRVHEVRDAGTVSQSLRLWLRQTEWEVFGTLTFRDRVVRCSDGSEERYQPNLQRARLAGVRWCDRARERGRLFMALERGTDSGRWHWHFLARLAPMHMRAALDRWASEQGFVQFAKIEEERRDVAIEYVMKYVQKDIDEGFEEWLI